MDGWLAFLCPLEQCFGHIRRMILNGCVEWKPDPEVIKLFFMLNSTEYEIYPAHKC